MIYPLACPKCGRRRRVISPLAVPPSSVCDCGQRMGHVLYDPEDGVEYEPGALTRWRPPGSGQ